MTRKGGGTRPHTQRFVQISLAPSAGVEVSTGQAWVGVDQQVGHGSADALYALTDEQYAAALIDGTVEQPFLAECWRGEHPELLLFSPGGGSWLPENWFAGRPRMLPPQFEGELWRHIDALGEPADGERADISHRLASGTAQITTGTDGISGLSIRLLGDGAYPRPAALIAGLTAGSSREKAREVLGAPVDGVSDEFRVEGMRMRLAYVDDGLAGIALERQEDS